MKTGWHLSLRNTSGEVAEGTASRNNMSKKDQLVSARPKLRKWAKRDDAPGSEAQREVT